MLAYMKLAKHKVLWSKVYEVRCAMNIHIHLQVRKLELQALNCVCTRILCTRLHYRSLSSNCNTVVWLERNDWLPYYIPCCVPHYRMLYKLSLLGNLPDRKKAISLFFTYAVNIICTIILCSLFIKWQPTRTYWKEI